MLLLLFERINPLESPLQFLAGKIVESAQAVCKPLELCSDRPDIIFRSGLIVSPSGRSVMRLLAHIDKSSTCTPNRLYGASAPSDGICAFARARWRATSGQVRSGSLRAGFVISDVCFPFAFRQPSSVTQQRIDKSVDGFTFALCMGFYVAFQFFGDDNGNMLFKIFR